MKRYLFVLTVFVAALLPAALAQRVPNFLLLTTPELELCCPLEGVLDEDDGQNFKDGSRLDVYQFYAEAGEVAELSVRAEFDSFLSLYDPEGNLLAVNDDSIESADAQLILRLPLTGRYLLVLSGYGGFDLGAYQISRQELRPVDDVLLDIPGKVVAVLEDSDESDNEGRSLDSFSLELTEAASLQIDMNSSTLDSYLYLLDSNDVLLAENDDGPFGTDAQLLLDLPAGSYRLIATTYSPDQGVYQLSVTIP